MCRARICEEGHRSPEPDDTGSWLFFPDRVGDVTVFTVTPYGAVQPAWNSYSCGEPQGSGELLIRFGT
jgi:hypothetical protein